MLLLFTHKQGTEGKHADDGWDHLGGYPRAGVCLQWQEALGSAPGLPPALINKLAKLFL